MTAEIIKRKCLECNKVMELDLYHLSQIRHLKCAIKHNKENNITYYKEYIKN